MATIKYNGMELEEFTSDKPMTFEKGVKAVCWESDSFGYNSHETAEVILLAYIPYMNQKVIVWLPKCNCTCSYSHCALLHEKNAPRRATNRELAKWLAQGNGEWGISKFGVIEKAQIDWFYETGYEKETLQSEMRVRKWDDTEWHEPTVDYIGIA